MRGVLQVKSVTVNEVVFQAMADAGAREVKALGTELAARARDAAPVGSAPKGRKRRLKKHRSRMSQAYGPLKSSKTRFATKGKKVKEYQSTSGKYKWRYYAQRSVIQTPFYGYFQDKGWYALTGPRSQYKRMNKKGKLVSNRSRKRGAAPREGAKFVPGMGYVTKTVERAL